jgi:galactokinase
MTRLMASAPGRICLFGEHQDFLGLPVVAAAIDLRISIKGTPRSDSLLRLDMPDIWKHDQIDLAQPIVYTRKRDYLRSCINVLRRKGRDLSQGWNCTMTSRIPINAGVSSSSAMIVAWLKFLIEGSSARIEYTPDDLARLAHEAEVLEFGEPGGMMDHFAAALGKVIYVDCRPPFKAEYLPLELDGFVLGDSLEKKQTLGVLGDSKGDVLEGLRMLGESYSGFDLHETPASEVRPLVDRLPGRIRRKVRANLVNRDLTIKAMEMFKTGVEPHTLGRLLTLHHEQLRDGIGVSTPKIDRMLEAALGAGALGGKINGSGGGGCMFAYAPGNEDAVAEAIESAGGKVHRIKVDGGANAERGTLNE